MFIPRNSFYCWDEKWEFFFKRFSIKSIETDFVHAFLLDNAWCYFHCWYDKSDFFRIRLCHRLFLLSLGWEFNFSSTNSFRSRSVSSFFVLFLSCLFFKVYKIVADEIKTISYTIYLKWILDDNWRRKFHKHSWWI